MVGGLGDPSLALPAQPLGPGHQVVRGQAAGLGQVGGAHRVALAGVGAGRLDQAGVGHEALGQGVDVLDVVVGGLGRGVGERQEASRRWSA